jgi:peptidoglycan/LPS O-acetylase OafA/YrhL
VFFVISGFIIPYSLWCGGYRLKMDFGRFVLKRLIRLDPPYLVSIAVIVALWYASAATPGFAGDKPNVSAPQLLAHLGYLNAFLGYPWLNIVFWTLAIEFQHYLLTALAFPAYASRNAAVRLSALVVLVALGFLIKQGAFVFVYGGVFALGILAFQKRAGLWSSTQYVLLVVAATVATCFMLEPLIAIVSAATSLVIAFVELKNRSRLAFLGAVSYSLYLLHVPVGGRVVNLGARFAHSVPAQLAVLAAAVATSYFAAWLLYRWVERPAQRWSASITYRRGADA